MSKLLVISLRVKNIIEKPVVATEDAMAFSCIKLPIGKNEDPGKLDKQTAELTHALEQIRV